MIGSDADTSALVGGRYRMGRCIGRGGMADVHDALDTRLQRAVALKILRPDLAARPDVRRRFAAEARAAARVSHPNLVAVYDTGEDERGPWIAMERLSGRSIADVLRGGPLPESQVLAIAGDVLAGLGAAHRAGIVHRDIKPGNVLLSPEGRAKLADFGIAKSLEPSVSEPRPSEPGRPAGGSEVGGDQGDARPVDGGASQDATASNVVMGTADFVAPERMLGEPASVQSDLWSVGVVLYEALTGTRPSLVGALTPPEALRPDVSPDTSQAVVRALQRRPEDRFPSAEAMAAALGASAATVPVSGAATAAMPLGAIVPGATPGAGLGAGSADATELLAVPDGFRSEPAKPFSAGGFALPLWLTGRVLAAVAAAAIAVLLLGALLLSHHGAAASHTSSTSTVAPTTAPSTTVAPTTTTAPLRGDKHRGHADNHNGGGD